MGLTTSGGAVGGLRLPDGKWAGHRGFFVDFSTLRLAAVIMRKRRSSNIENTETVLREVGKWAKEAQRWAVAEAEVEELRFVWRM